MRKLRFACLGSLGLLCFYAAGCHKRPPTGLAARVNGRGITRAHLDQVYQYQMIGRQAPASSAQARLLKLSLLRQLIDRTILVSYAQALHITIPAAALNQRILKDQAQHPKLPPAVLRHDARVELTLSHLFQKVISSKVQVTPQQIRAFYAAHRAAFQVPQPEYHVAEIVVTPHPGPVSNLARNKAESAAQARKKIQMLAGRLHEGANFAQLAEQYSENPNNAASGGDLGIIPQSALMSQVPTAVRAAILALQPGQVSPVVATSKGYFLFKLLQMIPAGKRKFADPQVQAAIRQALLRNRLQLLRSAFLAALRDRARVRNYYAERLLRQAGVKLP